MKRGKTLSLPSELSRFYRRLRMPLTRSRSYVISKFPDFAREYRQLRAKLGTHASPLNVIVSGSGHVNLKAPVFASSEAPVLIVTTTVGAKLLHTKKVPEAGEVCTVLSRAGTIRSRAILDQVGRRLRVVRAS